MDHETRYDLPSQDIRAVGEEDEQALSEGERNESTEITSECTPRSSPSPPSRVVFILAVIYTFPHSIIPYRASSPLHFQGTSLHSGDTITARVIAALTIFFWSFREACLSCVFSAQRRNLFRLSLSFFLFGLINNGE